MTRTCSRRASTSGCSCVSQGLSGDQQDAAALGKSPCLAAARGHSLECLTRSVEPGNGIDGLQRKRKTLAMGGEIREYVMSHYMLPYARFNATIYRLSI